MMFSIVIPLYNKQPFIALTLASVAAQTCRDFEVIVIDDGSSDGGAELAERCLGSFKDWSLIRQTNAGVSAARNKGISVARGQWVAFLDADDYWHPQHLSTLLDLSRAYPAVQMVATNLRTLPDAQDWNPEPWPPVDSRDGTELIEDLHRRWFQGIPFITSSVAVRTTTLKGMQPCFAPGESHGEDLDLWFRLSEITPIARSSRVLLTYREAPQGGLTSGITGHTEAPYLQRMLQRAQGKHLSKRQQSVLVYFVAQQRISIARRHLQSGDRSQALQLLAKAWPSALSRRWITTLLMALAFPPALIHRWDRWRYLRKAIHG
jgi:cellulose synthase/poly-beta-1,6-N-acetylglucosamine synthase-like glycosyltransferase